jgi:hypothetical protein
MIIEKPRDNFLQMILGEDFPSGPWLAVCLFILPEKLRQLGISRAEQEKLIDYGKKILAVADEGHFAWISWTTYFAIIRDEKQKLANKFNNTIAKLKPEDEDSRLWEFGIEEIDDRGPYKTFFDLEWQSYEAARQNGGKL